jgi:hypothetical protein
MNAADVVLTSLQMQVVAGNKMNDAIDAKLPEATRAVAKQQFEPISDALNQAVAAFGGPAYKPSSDDD